VEKLITFTKIQALDSQHLANLVSSKINVRLTMGNAMLSMLVHVILNSWSNFTYKYTHYYTK